MTAAAITIAGKPPTDSHLVLCNKSASANADGAGIRLDLGRQAVAN